MSDQTRKAIIRGAGVLILLLAAGSALLPLERGLQGRLVVGYLLLAAGAIELVAASARKIHKPVAFVASVATLLAGIRLVADPHTSWKKVVKASGAKVD